MMKHAMKHFRAEDWIDFVNQMGSRDRQDEMRMHLNSGCKSCARAMSLWQKVQQTAALEGIFQPPENALRVAKAAFVTAKYPKERNSYQRKIKEIVAELLFDSLVQPAAAGARTARPTARQMLYRADPYQVDVQIEAKPEESRLSVTGQLFDVSRPEIVAREVRVTLSNRRGNVVQTVTNRFGEFRGEVENLGDLELRIQGDSEKCIVVSLRDALRGISNANRGV